jgi:ABC-2 type transport system permease protein
MSASSAVAGAGVGGGARPSRVKTILTVIRAGLRSNFGLATLKHRLLKEKKDRWLVPLVGVAAIGVVPMFYGIVLLIENVYLVLKPMGQERALLSFGILAGQLLILLFGIYYVIAAFYFARDLEFLIPLPLRPGEVMASKFAVIVINEYLTVAAIVLPVVVTVGVLARRGVGYWVNATLVYLTLPIIPLALVSLVVVAMMRFINVSRKKDALILVGSLALIGLSFALQIGLGRSAGGGGPEASAKAVAAFFTSPDSLLNKVGAIFPPGIWATKAIAGGFSGEGLANLALLLGVSVVLFAGMVVAAEKLFYRGVIGLGETTGKRRRLTRDEMSRRVSSGRRAFAAIFGREWKIMNRTPIFLLNGILVSVFVPAIFVLMATLNKGGGVGSGGGGDPMALLKAMMSANPLVAILGAALFMTICGSINGTASSTFSREGAQFWISQTIPVAPREQASAKFLHSYLVAMLGVVTASVVAAVFLHMRAVHLAPAMGLSLVAGVMLTGVGMMIDLARPLLDWTNPQKAIKQNLNVLLALFADVGILTAVFFGAKSLIRAKLATNVVLGVVFVGLGALAAVSYMAMLKFADKRYPEIE